MSSPTTLSARQIKDELKRLRQGQALARPSSVLTLSHELRQALLGEASQALSADEQVVTVADTLQTTISRMEEPERLYARVDLNLAEAHSYRTLTERMRKHYSTVRDAEAVDASERVAKLLHQPQPLPSDMPSSTPTSSTVRPTEEPAWRGAPMGFAQRGEAARPASVNKSRPSWESSAESTQESSGTSHEKGQLRKSGNCPQPHAPKAAVEPPEERAARLCQPPTSQDESA